MSRICNIANRDGRFWLKREGRKNSRVRRLPEMEEESHSADELVSTDSLLNIEEVEELPRIGVDTVFRSWFGQMLAGWGARPEWPQLLVNVMHHLYLQERNIDRTYTGGRIITDRGSTPVNPAISPKDWDEKTSVRNLFNCCYEKSRGCLTIGDEAFWLLGFEVTNQLHHQGRRADLVAMSSDGGVVVFEAKLSSNSYAPVCALLEGLDYLTGLTCSSNFDRLCDEIGRLPHTRPPQFSEVKLNRGSRHQVIVLAPSDYFHGTFDRSPRGKGWRELARLRDEDSDQIRFRFAATDFKSPTAEWEFGE